MDASTAMLLSMLCDKYEHHKQHGTLTKYNSFECSGKEVDEYLCFKRRVQDNAFEVLRHLGILQTKIIGIPAKRHVIFSDNAAQILTKLLEQDSQYAENSAANLPTRNEVKKLKSCIYFLFQDDELVYIGKSENVKSRLTDHTKSSKIFNSYAYINPRNFEQKIEQIEGAYIKKYKPKYNVYYLSSCDATLASVNPYELEKHPISSIKNIV